MSEKSDSDFEEFVIGRVYKITNSEDDMYYFGSTFHTLEERLKEHMAFATNGRTISKVHQHLNKVGWDKVSIELVLEVPVKFDYELRIHENKYICKHLNYINCLNSKLSYYYRHLGLNKAQFLETPAEEIIKMEREYNIRVQKESFERAQKRLEKAALESNDPNFAANYEIKLKNYLEKVNIECAKELKMKEEKEREKLEKKSERERVKAESERKRLEKEKLRIENEKIKAEKAENERKRLENAKMVVPETKKVSILEIINQCAEKN